MGFVLLGIIALICWKPWLLPVVIGAGLLFDAWSWSNAHFGPVDAREAALAEASQGAAVIVLALLAWLRMGDVLPAWSPLAALAVMIWGALRLFNGAKFSVGWRDPKLISAALMKTGIGVGIYLLVWRANITWGIHELLRSIALFLYSTAPYGEWAVTAVIVWCVVTGLTKLFLVLRGFPAGPWPDDPGMPHGKAGFSGPDDAGWKL